MCQVDFIADHGGSREAGPLLSGQALRLTQQFLRASSMHAPTIFCFLLVKDGLSHNAWSARIVRLR